MFLGSYRLGDTLPIPLVVESGTGSAVDAADTPTFRVYVGSPAAGDGDTPVFTGTMVLRDTVGTTGWYTGTVVLSSDNGFASNKTYTIFCTTTVNGETPATPYFFDTGTGGA